MKHLLLPAFLLMTLATRAQSPSPAAPGVIPITYLQGHPSLLQPFKIYYPGLMIRLGMKGVVWVRCTAAPDGTVGTAELDRVDSLVIQSTDTAEVAKWGIQAQAELVAGSIKSVRNATFVPTAAPQTYLVRIPYGLNAIFLNSPPRPPVRRANHERPRK